MQGKSVDFVRMLVRAATRRRRTTLSVAVIGLIILVQASVVLGGGGLTRSTMPSPLPVPRATGSIPATPHMTVRHSYKNDVSPPVRVLPAAPLFSGAEHEAASNPRPVSIHKNGPDTVRQKSHFPSNMPNPTLNFNGIPFPGVACNCAPPDTNGEVGATQYVQIVNEGYQVFNKTTGASVLGPVGISTIWSGFGGVCETNGAGDPVVLYDQLANRWVITPVRRARRPAPTSASPSRRAATPPARTTATASTSAPTSSTTRSSRSGRTPTT